MAEKNCVLGLTLSSFPYIKSENSRFPLRHDWFSTPDLFKSVTYIRLYVSDKYLFCTHKGCREEGGAKLYVDWEPEQLFLDPI